MDDPTDLVRRGYDAIAPRFLTWDVRLPATTELHLQRLRSELEPGSRLLDLGCGPGTKTSDLGGRRIGVDISWAQLAIARRLDPTFAVVQADMSRPLFRARSFDAIVALFSIIHVARDRQPALVAELARWLRPGAPLVATLGARDEPGGIEDDWLGAPMYWSQYDADTNVDMLRGNGLEIESVEVDDALEDGEPVRFLASSRGGSRRRRTRCRGSGAFAPRTPPA